MGVVGSVVSCDRCRVSYDAKRSLRPEDLGQRRPVDFVVDRAGTLCVPCAPARPRRKGAR